MGPSNATVLLLLFDVNATTCFDHTTIIKRADSGVHNCFVNYTHATGSNTTVTTIRDYHGNHNS
jgi:hypothetical protein